MTYVIGFIAIAAVALVGFHGVSGYWLWEWNDFRKNGYKHKPSK